MRRAPPLSLISIAVLLFGCNGSQDKRPTACDARFDKASELEFLRPAEADSLAALLLLDLRLAESPACWVSAVETRLFCTALRADSTTSDSLLELLLAHHRAAHDDAGLCRTYRKAGDAWYKRSHVQRATTLLDSAIAAGQRSTDRSALANALCSRGALALDIELPDSAVVLHRAALRALAPALPDTPTAARIHGNLGYAFGWTGQMDSSTWHHLRAIDLLQLNRDERMLAWNRMNLSVALIDQGNYSSALDLLEQALRYYEQEEAQFDLGTCLYYMAYCQQHVLTADHVVRTYQRVIAINDSLGNEPRSMSVRMALGRYLIDLDSTRCANAGMSTEERDSMALHHSTVALSVGRKYRLSAQLADNLDAICDVERSLGMKDSALAHAHEAIGWRERTGDKGRLAGSYKDLGAAYRALGQSAEAERAYRFGLELIAIVPHPENAANLHQELQSFYAEQGKFQKAHAHLVEAQRIRNSLMDEEKRQELVQRQLRYDFDREQLADSLRNAAIVQEKEQQQELAELRAQRSQTRSWLAIGSGLLILIGGTGFYRLDHKRRRERFAKEAAQLEAKALRAQMDPHFIGNTLHAVNAYLLTNDPAKASSLLSRFAKWIRLMLERNRMEEVSLQHEIEAIRLYLELEQLRMHQAFTFTIEVADDVDAATVRLPPMLVQPLVENAIQHGLKDLNGDGQLALYAFMDGQELVVRVDDNGAGLNLRTAPESIDKGRRSLGGTIMRERLAVIEARSGRPARLSVTALEPGTRAELRLPT